MTSDGFVKVLDESTHELIVSEKRHKMPVTCLGFKHDYNEDPEYVLSGSPDYTYNIIDCSISTIRYVISYLVSLCLVGMLSFFVIGYI